MILRLLLFLVGVGLWAQSPAAAPVVPAPGDPLYAPVATAAAQNFHDRFVEYAIISVGPRALFGPALSAAIRMAKPPDAYPREWREGANAYGRNFGDALARHGARETARFATAAIMHEDFRYRPSGSKNVLARGAHALAFTFVDRSDSGRPQIALSNFAAAGANGFVGEMYLPRGFNNLSHAETRMAVAFGDLAAQNVLREFAPELARVARKLRIRALDFPIPEWWVKR